MTARTQREWLIGRLFLWTVERAKRAGTTTASELIENLRVYISDKPKNGNPHPTGQTSPIAPDSVMRQANRMRSQGARYREICETLGLPCSEKALQGRLLRWRHSNPEEAEKYPLVRNGRCRCECLAGSISDHPNGSGQSQ